MYMLYYKIEYWWDWSLAISFMWEDNYNQSISVDDESWWLPLISKLMSNGIGHVGWFWSWDLISWVWFSFKHKMFFAFHLIKYFTQLNIKQLGMEQRRNARYGGIFQTIFWWRMLVGIHHQIHALSCFSSHMLNTSERDVVIMGKTMRKLFSRYSYHQFYEVHQ